MTTDIGRRIASLETRLKNMERASRLGSASLDDTALQVKDANGSLRALVGQQADGTTAVNIVNGGPPPAPSTPTVAPALGGLAVAWDGSFAGDAVAPLDWARVEVHASPVSGFTPSATTLQATIETPQGAIVYMPAVAPQYVVLVARNTSGAASAPTTQAGPYEPRAVVDTDVADGSITTTKIADNAITTPKILAGAIQTAQLAALSITAAKLAVGSVDATALKADAITGKTITGGTIDGTVITGGTIQTSNADPSVVITDDNFLRIYNSSSDLTLEIGGSLGNLISYSQSGVTLDFQVQNGILYLGDVSGSIGPAANIFAEADGKTTQILGNSISGTYPVKMRLRSDAARPIVSFDDGGGSHPVDITTTGNAIVSGYVSHGTTWQTPSYTTGWSGNTTYNGATNWQTLRYRIDAEDNLWLVGAFKVASGAGTTIVTLPTGYRPATQSPLPCFSVLSGAFSIFPLLVTTGGAVLVSGSSGGSIAAGREYLVNAKVPLGNIT
ncbi:hypothetical protein OG552_10530 [Streptomyces sp. NBC_01476]|uniref:hypothetical protein n=1 Tax=Streptomyces sp. NBC_01476 TaxID=2903881 RepID=UPI002E2F6A38|nr:hypothetical protein [Streptomyces sp. NBC_01476]